MLSTQKLSRLINYRCRILSTQIFRDYLDAKQAKST